MILKVAFVNFFYRYGFWLLISVFSVSVGVLIVCIRNVIGLEKKNHLFSLPLLAEQKVLFPEAGRVILSIEGPQLTGRFAKLSYELQAPDGAIIRGGSTWVFFRHSGASEVRLKIRHFLIPQPGHYLVRIHGLQEELPDGSDYQILFSKPHFFQTIAYIIGITLSAVLIIGSLVFFILYYPTQSPIAK